MKATQRLVAGAFAVMALGVLAWPGGGAGAATPYQQAWWNRLQQGGLPASLPAPPNVPEGGLYVASGPDQPSAIAALRYPLDAAAGGTLTLKVANGSAAGAVINACTITASWNQGGNQPFASAPTYACDSAVPGAVDTAGTTITWKLPSGFYRTDAYALDVALVPGGTAPFQVAINPPDDSSFAPDAAAAGDASSSADAGSSSFDSSLAPATDSGTFDLGTDTSSSDSFALPSTPDATSSNAAPAATGTQAAPQARIAAPPLLKASDNRGERIAAVAGLLALAGALWWLAGHDVRAPRLLGSLGSSRADATDDALPAGAAAAAPVRGIGRFARPRTTPAQRLT